MSGAIQGESGTGKELVASAIHALSARAARRYETINCADLTRDLLRSELFGHERGAFSGAAARKAGVLAVANGGTVFLDEVGELATDAQAMLLRFLQSGEGRAVGATATIHVDVRIIAATHRDLEAAVERAAFREDLYYRLRRVVLMVPPLRERREDIRLLVEHVRRQINARYGLSIQGLTDEALDLLRSHPWPGNVRELEAVLEQAMIFQGSGWLMSEDLDLLRRRTVRQPEARAPVLRGRSGDERLHGAMRRQAALRLAATRGSVTSGELAAECDISSEQARRELVILAVADSSVAPAAAAAPGTCRRDSEQWPAGIRVRTISPSPDTPPSTSRTDARLSSQRTNHCPPPADAAPAALRQAERAWDRVKPVVWEFSAPATQSLGRSPATRRGGTLRPVQ